MKPADRVLVVQQGAAALGRLVDLARPRLALDDADEVEHFRTAEATLFFLELLSADAATSDVAALPLDAHFSMSTDEDAVTHIDAVADSFRDTLSASDRDALASLTQLLARYAAGEFMPPRSYFGLSDSSNGV